MDPQACLDRLCARLITSDPNDAAEAVQAASDLLVWLLSGGTTPKCSVETRRNISFGLARIADRLEDSDG